MTSTSSELIQPVSNAPLLVIDYNLLVKKDPTEVGRLFQASTELGFFYLKLDKQLDATSIFTLAENVFKLPLDTKMKYVMDAKNGVYFGYKAIGSMFADRQGTPDTIEFWNISKDDIILKDITEFPVPIIDGKNIVKEYMMKSHEIVLIILEGLSLKLGLDSRTLPDLHRLMQSSGDQLRLTKSTMYPTDNEGVLNVALGAHTDFGSITILYNRLGGLQVLGSNGEWLNVEPLSGHAIVNLGDSMVKLSGGLLNSNIHRVVGMPGLDEVVDRYSVVYFSRPENNVLMKSLMDNEKEEQSEDHILTAQEWIARRVKNYQIVNYKDESTYDMSRGTEGERETDVAI
jgi:isopenicillin N synthase-like dioxygenase